MEPVTRQKSSFHRAVWNEVAQHLRSRFTAGLLVLVPIIGTYLILRIFFDFLDGVLKPAFEWIFGRYYPGMGLVTLVIVVYLAGVIATNLIGRAFFQGIQQALTVLPVVRSVYGVVNRLVDSLAGKRTTGLNRVVLVEYPHPGLWTVAFLTGFSYSDSDNELLAVLYIPTAPTPTSGWLAFVPVARVFDTDISTQAALQTVLSGGISYPERFLKRPLPEAELVAAMPRKANGSTSVPAP
ncbi:MAG: DUF502 domain-containing protein [SAR202 cluster bacterium]|nr:DUF502 domain-containing protein [SAR202 cluster bacterium]